MLVEIILNGRPLEYEVENETTLGDVLDQITQWLAQRGSVLITVRLNDRPLDFAEESLPERALSIKQIVKIDLESQNARVLVVETVNELGQYLNHVARKAPTMSEAEMTREQVEHLVAGLGWCVDVLKRIESLLQIQFRDIDFEGEKLHKRLLRLGDIRDHIDEASRHGNAAALNALLRDSMAPLCDTVVRALPVIMEKGNLGRMGDELLEELADLAGTLKALPEKLEAIAIKISLGDTTKGMEEFAAAIGTLERAFTLLDRTRKELPVSPDLYIVEGKSFEDRSQGISRILDELIQAFERKDRVLISDLIEYEVAPQTEALSTIIENIEKTFKGACH